MTRNSNREERGHFRPIGNHEEAHRPKEHDRAEEGRKAPEAGKGRSRAGRLETRAPNARPDWNRFDEIF
ncbi:hypothetical protein [Flaviaesturariibacter terrae]